MQKSSLISVLKSLTEGEFKQLERFVLSPFFNRQRNVARLFEVLKKYYPLYASNALKKERVFKKLYPGEKYNDEKLRNLISDLLSLSLKFLAYTKMESDGQLLDLSAAEQLIDRNLDNL